MSLSKWLGWLLGLAGLVGLVLFLSVHAHGGQGGSFFRIGFPDPWLEWESRPDGHRFEIIPFRWSAGIGVASALALYYSAGLWRPQVAPAQDKPA
jgi:hypothetical protein